MMLTRHAASVAAERAALASMARALVALLPGLREHAQGCPGQVGWTCTPACAAARTALREARAVLFPWARPSSPAAACTVTETVAGGVR